ncbi:hypothetical protein M3650_18950 [Paenibacillus sp. MER TA 81-3]|uniref:hypothetical protein n=1 Tax=Paenibacillus sp. MER TA 81-3 TaxID=2939573 RepID=UPI00203D1442|nr:hypothetical protein [Paenibacillus sp. MER TA 81-3]MCM3340651.1 hypothetical protein [Paenibacillus sp. MER TA 81-3]
MSAKASAPKKPGEEIVLFLDEDMVISTGVLIPFIQSVEQGMDVALNRHSEVTNCKNVAGSDSLFPTPFVSSLLYFTF